jgi:hypothetical protein
MSRLDWSEEKIPEVSKMLFDGANRMTNCLAASAIEAINGLSHHNLRHRFD